LSGKSRLRGIALLEPTRKTFFAFYEVIASMLRAGWQREHVQGSRVLKSIGQPPAKKGGKG
jgi:hypothetical protein